MLQDGKKNEGTEKVERVLFSRVYAIPVSDQTMLTNAGGAIDHARVIPPTICTNIIVLPLVGPLCNRGLERI